MENNISRWRQYLSPGLSLFSPLPLPSCLPVCLSAFFPLPDTFLSPLCSRFRALPLALPASRRVGHGPPVPQGPETLEHGVSPSVQPCQNGRAKLRATCAYSRPGVLRLSTCTAAAKLELVRWSSSNKCLAISDIRQRTRAIYTGPTAASLREKLFGCFAGQVV